MKSTVTFFIAGLFLTQVVSAQNPGTTVSRSPQELYDYYSHKRTTNNTVGWILLVSGVAMQAGGLASAASQPWVIWGTPPAGYNKNKGASLFIAGLGTALLSIPFFISAHRNKIKARLALERRSVSFDNRILYNSNYTAIILRVPL